MFEYINGMMHHLTDIADSGEGVEFLRVLGRLQLTHGVEARVEGHTAGRVRTGVGELVLAGQGYFEGSPCSWNPANTRIIDIMYLYNSAFVRKVSRDTKLYHITRLWYLV